MSNKIECVYKEKDNKKLSVFLKEDLEFSQRLIRTSKKNKSVLINGEIKNYNYELQYGDKIEVSLQKEEEQHLEPEDMDIKILYEDEDILGVYKPPFMVVHPTKSHKSGTLSNGVMHYFGSKNLIVRLINRLDMNTSGIVLIAKNQYAHSLMSKSWKSVIDFKKKYLAIVHGNMEEKEGTIDLPIYRETDDSILRTVDERGQRSITKYKVLKSFVEGDLLELTLETGRTHQIRVHLSHLGHPIFGDSLYGSEDLEFISRQALHAYYTYFKSPRTKKEVEIEIPMPDDMAGLLETLQEI